MISPALRYASPSYMPKFQPDSTCVLWLPGQDDPQSATIRDRSGKGNNGTITGATWVRLGNGLWSLDFDGNDDKITVTDVATVQNIWDGGGSFVGWINPDSDGQGDNGNIISKVRLATSGGWELRTTGEAAGKVKINFFVYFSSGSGYWQCAATVASIGVWSHVVVTYNSSATANEAILYVNGVAQSWSSGARSGTRVTDALTNLLIGDYEDGSRNYDGKQALQRLFKTKILTQPEITNSYNQERNLFGV